MENINGERVVNEDGPLTLFPRHWMSAKKRSSYTHTWERQPMCRPGQTDFVGGIGQ